MESNLDLSQWFAPQTPFTLHLEDGSSLDARLTSNAELPALAPPGYQQLEIAGQHLTIAVAPKTCFSMAMATETSKPHGWGLTAQLYSLRREGDGGFGDTEALEKVLRSAGERGADALGISPIHAMFANDPHRYSPYSPSSRLFLNSLYASPGAILGESAWRQAIEDARVGDEMKRLETQTLIDWPAAANAKWKRCTRFMKASVQVIIRCTKTSTASATAVAKRWKITAASKHCVPSQKR